MAAQYAHQLGGDRAAIPRGDLGPDDLLNPDMWTGHVAGMVAGSGICTRWSGGPELSHDRDLSRLYQFAKPQASRLRLDADKSKRVRVNRERDISTDHLLNSHVGV